MCHEIIFTNLGWSMSYVLCQWMGHFKINEKQNSCTKKPFADSFDDYPNTLQKSIINNLNYEFFIDFSSVTY